jgi:hypothetical protein
MIGVELLEDDFKRREIKNLFFVIMSFLCNGAIINEVFEFGG